MSPVGREGGGHLLCEPNVSEGRDADRIAALTAAVGDAPDIELLHASADADHNRMVLAYRGAPAPVVEATRRLAAAAFDTLDLSRHEGRHPRVGVLDVVPFVVDRDGASVDRGTALAACREFGAWVGDRGIPVFYYEEAATAEHRRPLPAVRRGGPRGLAERMAGPGWKPDEGPARLHPTAGATVVGVRASLVRFNVNLDEPDPGVARRIAGAIRESSGGLPAVRALGLELTRRGMSQVTINLTDYRETSLADVFAAVVRMAGEGGVAVVGTEVIGPIPAAALVGVDERVLDSLDPAQILSS